MSLFDRSDDRIRVLRSKRYVSWRDPAQVTLAFQVFGDQLGKGRVLTRVADEDPAAGTGKTRRRSRAHGLLQPHSDYGPVWMHGRIDGFEAHSVSSYGENIMRLRLETGSQWWLASSHGVLDRRFLDLSSQGG